MSVGAKRYIGGTLGFAFAAVWVTAGIGSALICIAAAGLGYVVVLLSEQGRLGAVVASKDLVARELRERRDRPAATGGPTRAQAGEAREQVRADPARAGA